MTYFIIISIITIISGAISAFMFRKGGVYNPIEPMQDKPIKELENVNKENMLILYCKAIRDYEGDVGSLNYQLNNPGDCRCSPVGYLPKYGNVECIDTDTDPRYLYHKGKFAKFPNYTLGWEYLKNLVHHLASEHADWTIIDFFDRYAPATDSNSPHEYAKFVAKRCGVPVDITMAKLFG